MPDQLPRKPDPIRWGRTDEQVRKDNARQAMFAAWFFAVAILATFFVATVYSVLHNSGLLP